MCTTEDRDLAAKSGNVIASAAKLSEIIERRIGYRIDANKLINLIKSDWAEAAPLAHIIHKHERRKRQEDRRGAFAHAEWCGGQTGHDCTCRAMKSTDVRRRG